MKARLITSLACYPDNLDMGSVVEGALAVELCAAGYAVPIVETEVREKAVAKKTAKETRVVE